MGKNQMTIIAVLCTVILSGALVFSAMCGRYDYRGTEGNPMVFDKLTGRMFFAYEGGINSFSYVTGKSRKITIDK